MSDNTVSTKEKLVAAASYLWILFFLPLIVTPNSKFGRFHANQALLNLIFSVVIAGLSMLFGWIPLLGGIIGWILRALAILAAVWGILFSLLGQKHPYPFFGHITLIK